MGSDLLLVVVVVVALGFDFTNGFHDTANAMATSIATRALKPRVALALAAVPLQPALQREAADEGDTFLVRGSESAAARDVIDARFRGGSEMPAGIAHERDGGLTSEDRARIDADAEALCSSGEIPAISRVGTPFTHACGQTDPLDLAPPVSISGDTGGGTFTGDTPADVQVDYDRITPDTEAGCAEEDVVAPATTAALDPAQPGPGGT
jgi:hypothetical protein